MQAANLEDTEKDLLAEVEKEIEKLEYYLEESDEMIEEGDFVEIEVTHNRTTAICADQLETSTSLPPPPPGQTPGI